jgi:hypothetical protein
MAIPVIPVIKVSLWGKAMGGSWPSRNQANLSSEALAKEDQGSDNICQFIISIVTHFLAFIIQNSIITKNIYVKISER